LALVTAIGDDKVFQLSREASEALVELVLAILTAGPTACVLDPEPFTGLRVRPRAAVGLCRACPVLALCRRAAKLAEPVGVVQAGYFRAEQYRPVVDLLADEADLASRTALEN
jgi:hypothetical protein